MDPVDVNAVDCMGQTPLDDAIRHGNSLVAGLLADSGGIDSDSQGIQQVRERHAEAKKQRERAAAKAAAVDHVWGTPEDLDRAKAANFLGRLEAFSQIPQELCGIADGLLRGFEEAKAANQHNRARKQSKRGQASLGPSGDVLFEALESVAFRLSEWQSLLATSELQRSSRVPSIAVSPIEILNDISMHQMAVSNTLQKTSQVIEHIIDRLLELRNAHITGPETTASPSAVKRQGKADFDL